MNGKDILIGLGHVNEQFIHEAEIKKPNNSRRFFKYAMPIAASFAIVLSLFAFNQNGGNTPPTTPNPDILPPITSTEDTNNSPNYKLQFGEVSMASASRIAIKGHFWYELDVAQAEKVLPVIAPKYDMDGVVHYSSADGKASLYEIRAAIKVNEGMSGEITISPNEIVKDYSIVGEAIISQIEDTPIEAGLFITDKNSKGEQNCIYYANFKLGDIAYYMEFTSKNEKADDAFTSVVADVVLGGKADLSIFQNPTIPKIIEEDLTESEAYSEADFGKYLIKIPNSYLFNSANRFLNQNNNLLFASWSKGYDDIRVQVSILDEDSKARIVSPKDTELYDMSLYSIPWVDSMPRDTYHIIENPVFRIEDLTLEMINLREYTRGEAGDPSGNSLNMRFSVLYDEVVVAVNSEGVSAEYLYEELTALTTK
ncbi:MAG: hypothetical protein RR313_11400 [Anaerovoracaceae bacterium]